MEVRQTPAHLESKIYADTPLCLKTDLSADQGRSPSMITEWSQQTEAEFIQHHSSFKEKPITYTLSCGLLKPFGFFCLV